MPNRPRLMKEIGSNMTGRLEPEYEAEVERMTESREVAFAAAQRRLQAAERKTQRLSQRVDVTSGKTKRLTKRELVLAWEAVEARRAELESLSSLMTSTPASAQNRGTRSFRPVPIRHGGNL